MPQRGHWAFVSSRNSTFVGDKLLPLATVFLFSRNFLVFSISFEYSDSRSIRSRCLLIAGCFQGLLGSDGLRIVRSGGGDLGAIV